MGKIQDISNKLAREGTIEAQERALVKIIRDNRSEALDLNLNQLFEGKDSDGKEITPRYSPITVMIKQAKGQPSDRVTLKYEGDFYSKFTLEGNAFPMEVTSNDTKTAALVGKYGESIFGLDKQSKEIFVQDIKPEVQDYYRSLIHV